VVPIPGRGFAEGARAAEAALREARVLAGARVAWAPVRGGVAADGQHGFTFGYMTALAADGSRRPLKYLAYWVRGPGGWRAAAYKWSPRPSGEVPTAPLPPALPARLVAPARAAARVERWRRELADAERAFSARAQRVGLGAAFAEYGSADAMNMGGPQHAAFVVGADAIGRLVGAGTSTTSSPVSWAPTA
jgi:hypothetical protein